MNPELDYAQEERIRGAAKEMHEALRLAQPVLQKLAENRYPHAGPTLRAFRAVNAALAKAEQGSQS